MSTSILGSLPSALTSPRASTTNSSLSQLKPSDFINMMVTQLQNQDPLQPTSNQDLLAQMSQIGQLQSSTQLTTTLQGLTQQNQISAGASLIGKTVTGLDARSNPVSGLVNSVSVTSTGINLQLDNGNALGLSNVTGIAPGPSSATTATPASAVAH